MTAAKKTIANTANVTTRVPSRMRRFVTSRSSAAFGRSPSGPATSTSSSSIDGHFLLASDRFGRPVLDGARFPEPRDERVDAQRDGEDRGHAEPREGSDEMPIYFHRIADVRSPDVDDRGDEQHGRREYEDTATAVGGGIAEPGHREQQHRPERGRCTWLAERRREVAREAVEHCVTVISLVVVAEDVRELVVQARPPRRR